MWDAPDGLVAGWVDMTARVLVGHLVGRWDVVSATFQVN